MKRVVLFFLFVLLTHLSFSQKKKISKEMKLAEMLFKQEAYSEALPIFLDHLKNDTTDESIYYKAGICFFYSNESKENSINFFKKYNQRNGRNYDSYFFLAKVYHTTYKFDEAMDNYNIFLEKLKEDTYLAPSEMDIIRADVENEISWCNYGKVLIKNKVKVIIENLGDSVNTPYSEYGPVISSDEKKLIFTGRYPKNNKISEDGDYYEDIYSTTQLKGGLYEDNINDEDKGFKSLVTEFEFSVPHKIKGTINSKDHEGAIQLSSDGNRLFFYKNEDIWATNYTDSVWSQPSKLENINSKEFESSIFISYDEQTLYIASERPGGYGGLDIYAAKKKLGGEWGDFVNLGPDINTSEDEDAPYIDPDGKTLYFSSKGHTGMGKYDIYKSELVNGKWSPVQNMGHPVNSPENDIFFVMTPRYNRAYFSSDRYGGHGKMDIYRMSFAEERNPLAEIKGYVLEGDSVVPAKSKIVIRDINDESDSSVYYSDPITGQYLLLVNHGKKYKMDVQTEGFVDHDVNVRIPRLLAYYQLYQEVKHVHLKDSEGNIIGQKIEVNNSFFETDQDSLTANDSDVEVLTDVKFYVSEDSLVEMMKADTSLRFDIPQSADISFYQPKETNLASTSSNDSGSKTKKQKEEFRPVSRTKLSEIHQLLKIEETVIETKEEMIVELEKKDLKEEQELEVKPSSDNQSEITKKSETTDDGPEADFNVHVLFDFAQTEIHSEYVEILDVLIDYLKKNTEELVEIIGHTDAMGTESYNMNLSYARARATRNYFTKKGIANSRIKILGKGESDPIAPNNVENSNPEEKGQRLNRRVEFRLYK